MDRFFLSDVHLFPEPEIHPGRERFVSFLNTLHDSPEPGELWILGDLFDFWFEYRSVVPVGHEKTLSAMKRLSGAGWKIHFLPGNHDFWVGSHFKRETGAEIHFDDNLILNLSGKRVLLAHGDGLGAGDNGYKIMKPILRSSVSRFLFSLLHPDLGIFLARRFSDTSKRILRRDLDSIPQNLLNWTIDRFEEDIDIIIMGHTHLDTVSKSEKGIYVSLGDWLTRFTYCHIRDDSEEPELLAYTDNLPDIWKGKRKR